MPARKQIYEAMDGVPRREMLGGESEQCTKVMLGRERAPCLKEILRVSSTKCY